MKLIDLLEKNSNVAHSKAYTDGCTSAEHFLATHGVHQGKHHPECPHKEGSEEHRAWHDGFQKTVHGSIYYDGD